MISPLKVKVISGSGGPDDNAIPAYADKNAPNGAWIVGVDGQQLMVKNSEVSGIEYIIVNPDLLTPEENTGSKFMTLKGNGSPNYVKTWIYNPETGKGDDFTPGQQLWLEYSHMERVADQPEEPPVEPPVGEYSIFVINWTQRTITLRPE